MADWKPSAPLENLRRRAQMLAQIRQFFSERAVLEVETPLLGRHTVPDVYIESMSVDVRSGDRAVEGFLQTSPEFFMKRLLAAGSGSIYQISKAFRQEEQSPRHNPEFTLLEWYRVGFTLEQLMDELEELVRQLLNCDPIPRIPYRDLFLDHLEMDPHRVTAEELQAIANEKIDLSASALSKTDLLQLLLAHSIEPELPNYCFIHDYPEEQASLSTLAKDCHGNLVAKRFELFGGGMELANGYLELLEPEEQRLRFESDNATRAEKGLARREIDEQLMAALESGLPVCSGVAAGVDRLLMLSASAKDIDEVISFGADRV